MRGNKTDFFQQKRNYSNFSSPFTLILVMASVINFRSQPIPMQSSMVEPTTITVDIEMNGSFRCRDHNGKLITVQAGSPIRIGSFEKMKDSHIVRLACFICTGQIEACVGLQTYITPVKIGDVVDVNFIQGHIQFVFA